MNEENIKKWKDKLITEKEKLESGLKTVGHINPENPNDWEADPGEFIQRESDKNEVADKMEEFETNSAILKQLETQLLDVNAALQKIEEGKYGICEVSGEEISEERLEANPAARTCKDHMN